MTRTHDAIVVGGGFFGASLALHLERELGQRVALLERGPALLERASFANQARVHHGYHYPRSLLTALRCRINFPRFLAEYGSCVVGDFEKYYAVAGTFSKVTAAQFRQFCERVGAPIERAPKPIRALFDAGRVEDVFRVHELAFDAVKLRDLVVRDLAEAKVDVRTGHEALRVAPADGGGLEVSVRSNEGEGAFAAERVYNCTYSRLNGLLVRSGLPPIRLKHELTEMPLVEVPDEVKGRAFTLMCGPFFSVMPFPSRGLYTLSHVRYTPHAEWADAPGQPWRDPYEVLASVERRTSFPHMIRDVARYMPCLAQSRHVDSLWEVKTVLPKSEVDDSRPVLYREDSGLPHLTSLLGAKIDNVFDVLEFIDAARDAAAGGRA